MGKIPIESIMEQYGSEEEYKRQLSKKLSGKHFYTNGIEDKKFGDDEIIPEGWWKGRTNCGKGTKGYIFINNGKEQTQIPQSQAIPDGWVKGALPFTSEHKEKISAALKQYTKTDEHRKNISINHKSEEYKQKVANTLMQKYGVEHTFQATEIKQKIKETNLQKYGVEHPSQCEEIKERVKQTVQEHFGVNYPMQAKEVQEKSKQTCLKKYGVEWSSQCEEIKEKIKQSNIQKYGVEHTFQCEQIKEKAKKTIQEHFGVEHHLQNPKIMQKQIQTNLERRGIQYNIFLPKQYSNNSQPNQAFAKLLEDNNIEYTREFPLQNYCYDFKVGNILIEIDPFATHNSLWGIRDTAPTDKNYHQQKSKVAVEQGYQVIHVFDWDNKDKIIELLKQRPVVYARKCLVKEITNKQCNDFLNEYHLQGTCRGQKIKYGLFYNNQLVSVMTFGKPRYNKNYEWELLRYSSIYAIVGGAEKMFKHFMSCHRPKSIISYCDNAKFKGDVYKKLNFHLLSQGTPTKHWYNPKTQQHITNNLLLSLGFDNIFHTNYGKGVNNEQLIIQEGYVPVYDCGQSVYEYKK